MSEKCQRWETTLTSGGASLFYPADMSVEDQADLIEWLVFVAGALHMQKLRRLDVDGGAITSPEPVHPGESKSASDTDGPQ